VKVFLIALILFLPMYICAQDDQLNAMSTDSITASADSVAEVIIDTEAVYRAAQTTIYNSPIINGEKPKWYDIEQQRKSKNDAWVFFILLQMLIVLVVLKLAFHNDFDNLFKVFANANIASQIGRAAKDDITLSSALMSTIFITTMSVFTRFVLLHYYPHSVLQNNFSIVILIILFTFFSVTKYLSLKFIGNIFEITPTVDEYLFNLSAITRTIGISMIPLLFMLYASSEKYFNFILIISMIILSIGLVMVVIRGLSTSYKLMYSSMYHFLIYICVEEILPIFLFIKLLTKTVI
jgi:Domain of unknown function (DUF4271)